MPGPGCGPAPDVVRGIGNEASKRRGVGNGGGGGRVNWMSEAQSCGLHLSFEGAESRFIFSNVPSSSHFHFSRPPPYQPANLVIRAGHLRVIFRFITYYVSLGIRSIRNFVKFTPGSKDSRDRGKIGEIST